MGAFTGLFFVTEASYLIDTQSSGSNGSIFFIKFLWENNLM